MPVVVSEQSASSASHLGHEIQTWQTWMNQGEIDAVPVNHHQNEIIQIARCNYLCHEKAFFVF